MEIEKRREQNEGLPIAGKVNRSIIMVISFVGLLEMSL